MRENPASIEKIKALRRKNNEKLQALQQRTKIQTLLSTFTGTRAELKALLTKELKLQPTALREDYEGASDPIDVLPNDVIHVECADGTVAIHVLRKNIISIYYKYAKDGGLYWTL